MSAKHTPGPWSIIGEKDLPQHDDLMIVAFDVQAEGERPDDSLYICNIGSEGGEYSKCAPVDAGEKWPVSLANAKLIAAAPKMAAALLKLITEGGALSFEGTHDISDGEVAAILVLREAGVLP